MRTYQPIKNIIKQKQTVDFTEKLNQFIQSYLTKPNTITTTTKPRRTENKNHLKLIQEIKNINPSQTTNLLKDLESQPSTTEAEEEHELAQLIRLSIKYKLTDQQNSFLSQKPIQEYRNQHLIHGARLLLPQDQQSLKYILNQKNSKLEPWVESDLLQRLTQEQQGEDDHLQLFDVLTKLTSRHHNRDRTINLVETLLSHIKINPSIETIDQLADQIQQITGLEIFRDSSTRLGGKLFDRFRSSFTFEEVWSWYQLSKTRRGGGGGVLENSLVSILEYGSELSRRSDRIEEILADFHTLTFSNRSLSSTDLLKTIENLLWLSILIKDTSIAVLALDPELTKFIQDKKIDGEKMVGLLAQLIPLAESREQAWWFYERLSKLGKLTPQFFDQLLRDYLSLCESPPSTRRSSEERIQALSMSKLMSILDKMKASGIMIDNQTYSILLNHYSKVVKMNPRNLSTRLQLERIHTLIKLDMNLEPDQHLIHQLFKAFSYNGLYEKAWSMWDQHMISSSSMRNINSTRGDMDQVYKKISNPSFATMFDLAGFESERYGDGRLNLRAIQGWKFLVNQALRSSSSPKIISSTSSYLNKNLFDSWIECLCRSRRIEEALTLVFFNQYPPPSQSNPSSSSTPSPQTLNEDEDQLLYEFIIPFIDKRTLSILLRFSKREDYLLIQSKPSLITEHQNQNQKSYTTAITNTTFFHPVVINLIQTCFPQLVSVVQDQGPFN
ncbi:hypothetical protein MJO28_009654 [Puccinia striiformis f. sp. tritici]|uniref:Uncharacterized protein n=2 Tax=Puccinia striiformis TaxID=27350 RepID=A0A2S4VM41_9BASI|nr:hypothetical protein Pst134EA_017486 [Puccinia striiformis f. sp. tritici]KAH9461176.1 hypothetical protein Pst134EA_017486 [Puccinia striiformis f. sp. tritici]KAI7947746.1 hypothetical protein MJO28_009654 [Puccinia striiformis f. sp. tritici]KAI9607331.1 hypothetical protein H4Q26_005849 [Puccinia striiformis f. sp. tritici PST-130]POW10615.1 hypothetical protein PSTT_06005 [Puccinia striiformis]